MRGSSARGLLAVSCGGFLMGMPVAPVDAAFAFYDYRSDADRNNPLGCEDPVGNKNRYLQIEVFDYNYGSWIEATWTQTSDECGLPLADGVTPYSRTMEYFAGEAVPDYSIYSARNDQTRDGGTFAFITDTRLQMDMYMCVPWGNYELTVKTKSSNNGNAMEKIAWEVEYGPDQYHTWDTLNTPFFDIRNSGDPDSVLPGYAPIPPDGVETTYTWPLPEAEGYYSLMYSGPFPPLTGDDCPNLLPSGVFYEGCYPGGQSGWTTADDPSGSSNGDDAAELYRMFDGYDDKGIAEEGVMTLEKCKGICAGYTYFGLESAIKCVCGNTLSGSDEEDCGLDDDTAIPEYEYLCSGDSRVLCGTDDKVSVYLLDPPPVTCPAEGTGEGQIQCPAGETYVVGGTCDAPGPCGATDCCVACPGEAVPETSLCDASGTGAGGDPHMTGFLGQKFDFTGEDGQWYALVADANLNMNMRVTSPVADLPEITYITGLSVLATDADGIGHSIVIEVRDPHSLKSSCPAGLSHCLADGALRVVVDEAENLLTPGTVSLGKGVQVSAVNLPGACRSFGFEKYWERKALENSRHGRRMGELVGAGEWVLADPSATNMEECIEYVVRAELAEGGLFAHQSEHASFQIVTPKVTIRLSHGRLHQVAMRDPTDQYDLPDHLTWQMNIIIEHNEVSRAAKGILGETLVPTRDSNGMPIMAGLEAIRGQHEDYLVDGPLGTDFVQDTRAS